MRARLVLVLTVLQHSQPDGRRVRCPEDRSQPRVALVCGCRDGPIAPGHTAVRQRARRRCAHRRPTAAKTKQACEGEARFISRQDGTGETDYFCSEFTNGYGAAWMEIDGTCYGWGTTDVEWCPAAR